MKNNKFYYALFKHTLLILMLSLSIYKKGLATIPNYTGVYQYNKGLNKANAALYIMQFKEDSAFFYLNGISGMPDFLTTEIKGFLFMDGIAANFNLKDSCALTFDLKNQQISITQSPSCNFEFPIHGKYKKTANIAKKSSTFLISYTEKPATLKLDSLLCYEAPSFGAKIIFKLVKNAEFKIIDEFKEFFLIEEKSKSSQFLWIPKSSLGAARKK